MRKEASGNLHRLRLQLSLFACFRYICSSGSDKNVRPSRTAGVGCVQSIIGTLAFDCLFLFLSVFLFYFAFNDSIVYYTDIQVLDSVELDKNGFLPKRDLYTYQLKNYLEYNLKKPDYTCMIYFSENRKKLEKEAVKVKGKYKKSKNMVLQVVKPEAFTFAKPQE